MQKEDIERFIGIPAHSLGLIGFFDSQGRTTSDEDLVSYVMIELHRDGRGYRCACGYRTDYYYDVEERQVRDLPWGPWPEVWLVVPRFRIDCPYCGVKTEPLDWIVPNCTYTCRLASAVAQACREVRSLSAIAAFFRLSWDTVKRIDKMALQSDLEPPDFTGVKRLGLDEFALRKGHRYATAFVDLDTGRPLWFCLGRDGKSVRTVFQDVFGPEVCANIEVVSMDMWEPYELAVKDYMPNAKIVWDKFHIIKNYVRDVLNRVRIDEAKKHQSKEEREQWKGSKWIVLKNPENLRDDEPARLKQLLNANAALAKVYVMAEILKQCWDFTNQQEARKWFNGWYGDAVKSGVKPLAEFARKLKSRLPGILAHCKYPVNNGLLEGLNNWIKVIKRIAFGFRDFDYFFLKIRGLWEIRNGI